MTQLLLSNEERLHTWSKRLSLQGDTNSRRGMCISWHLKELPLQADAQSQDFVLSSKRQDDLLRAYRPHGLDATKSGAI